MNRKRVGFLLIAAGTVLALVVGIFVYGQVSEAQRVQAALPRSRVVVSTADIPPRTEIPASALSLVAVPDTLLQADAATTIEDVVGKFSPDAIVKGQVINSDKIGDLAAKNSPSFAIPKGDVMYVMPVSFAGSQFSIAQVNALRSGDRVDLLYSTLNVPQGLTTDQLDQIRTNPIPYLQTRIMLQDLQIQDIGSYAPDGTLQPASAQPAQGSASTASSSNIIFIVSPEEALVLKWLRDSATYYKDSNIEMVLRSPADNEEVDTNLTVNLNYMRSKYNLAPPPPNALASTAGH